MVHVALACAERREVAYVLPVSVDGMLVVATVVMVDDERHIRRVRPTRRLAFSVGVAASLAANVAAAHPTIGARIVAAWPAVALLLVVEMLARPPAATAGVPPTPAVGRETPPAAVAADPPQLFAPPGATFRRPVSSGARRSSGGTECGGTGPPASRRRGGSRAGDRAYCPRRAPRWWCGAAGHHCDHGKRPAAGGDTKRRPRYTVQPGNRRCSVPPRTTITLWPPAPGRRHTPARPADHRR